MSDSMWHEARRQERRIRGMLVDYRRRAERRRDFYERIKADPTQFLQVHGRQCKINLDPAVAAAADSSTAMMPWQNDVDNLIDRFDVRAHLDFIPVVSKDTAEEELSQEERQLNYERYRIIAQNSFLGLSEEKFLKQLNIEEQFGYTDNKEKKKERTGGAAIGFNYEDGTGTSQSQPVQENNDESEHSDSDLDVDLSINVSKMDPTEAHEMNRHGRNYGMSSNDFYSFLIKDLDEAESYRQAKEEEHEKALYAGRKSRRERRAHREKRLANRVISPPSYAARKSPDYAAFRQSKSASRSPTPDNAGKITYITSFGDEDDSTLNTKPTYADKVKGGKPKKKADSSERTVYISKSKESENNAKKRFSRKSTSRSKSRQRISRSREMSRKRSRSYSRSKSRSSSRSRRSNSGKRQYRGKRSRSSSSSSSSSSRVSKKRSKSSSSSSSSSSEDDKELKKSTSRSKSKSPSVSKELPPKQIPRYYGRRKSDRSSSESSDSDTNDKETKEMTIVNKAGYGNTGTSIKKSTGTSSASLSIQERLKRKRQALLNRQFKADKIAEMSKAEREKQEQQTREDELREMSIKLRKRQRERRHAYDSDSSGSTQSGTVPSKSPKKEKDSNNSGSTSPSPRKDDNEQKNRPEQADEPRESHTSRKSPAKVEEKRIVYQEKRDDHNNRRYSNNYDRGYGGGDRREWRDSRDRRDDRDKRYNRDRREDNRTRWDDRDRRNDRDSRDDRNRWGERDRRDWRYRDRRDRCEENSDTESNTRSRPVKSLVDY